MKFAHWTGFILLVLSIYILWQVKQLLLLLFTAVVLANGLNAFVGHLQAWGMRRGKAVIIAVFLLIGTVVGTFWLVIPAIIKQGQQLVKLVPAGLEEFILKVHYWLGQVDPQLVDSLPTINEIFQQFQPLVNQIANRGLSVFYNSLGVLLSLILLLALTLMLLVNPVPYRQGFIRLFPAFYRARVDWILTRCDRALSGWLTGIIFHMLVMILLSLLGLLVLKIPLAFSQALLSGFLTFIPNLGPVLGMISPLAIALLEDPWKPWGVIVIYASIYFVIKQIDYYFLIPRVIHKEFSILPAISLVAQIFFASWFGFLGLFLAIPLLIISQVWIEDVVVKDILDGWLIQSQDENT